ncbi:putative Thiopurine S-methyltransferase (TPMT) [Leishmania naiffi]|uniref:Thiopurine S-methyltransferase (TPMT) n=1 Tax=Leishmania naiffi TaxID=5678 RepID=A0AAW3C5B5_9TRYP
MMHTTQTQHIGVQIPNAKELEDQVLLNRLRKSRPKSIFSLKALTTSRMQGFVAAGGIVLGAAVFLGPWLWGEVQELMGNRYVPLPPSQMPHTSPEWWENEWRKMNPLWRAGESMSDFFVGPYRFVKEQTGRDMSSAADFVRTSPSPSPAVPGGQQYGFLDRLTRMFHRSASPTTSTCITTISREGISSKGENSHRASASAVMLPNSPQMLVPLCGDSPIIRTAALQGFEVDGVDSSQTAIQSAASRTEEGLPRVLYSKIHLHWKNFFSPELWEGPLKEKKYDVIYERQGMTSLNREQRPDYAYLLKRAMKDDGLIYVEGIFRTGRVKGNKLMGPPYSLSKRELEQLFPLSEGYYVRCEEKTDAMQQLSRENRILKRVPKELYVTPFSCVVFREATVNLRTRTEPLQHPEPPILTPPQENFAW